MGLFGLRRFVDAAGITHLLPVPSTEEDPGSVVTAAHGSTSESDAPEADHVLIDLNCIVHSCFGASRESSGAPAGLHSKHAVMQAVLYRLEVLLTRVVVPRRSLTICLDGPAPLAKLQTQRLRRRKVGLMDPSQQASRGGRGEALNSLAVTAGSLFMVELENAIATLFKSREGKGFLGGLCPVFLYGTTVMGEGESKISQALLYLAYGDQSVDDEQRHCPSSSTAYTNDGPPPYRPDDTVVVLGNDIDLVMTCLGATFYHNLFVVSPASLQCVSVSDLLYRWLKASSTSASVSSSSRITLEELPSLRVDFMYLFLLNGGDHYTGAGDVAMGLWQRYKNVRGASFQRRRGYSGATLVRPSLDSLDVNILADVLQAEEYTGEADVEVGMRLLRSALWSLYTTISGICPDYTYLPPQEDQPNLSHLRAAAAFCKREKRKITFRFLHDSAPLAPLEHFVALMPTLAAMPSGVAAALQQPPLKHVAATLLNSNEPKEIIKAAKKAVEAASGTLKPSESFLQQFTAPVQLNVVPPRKRWSRHEQHRRIAMANKAAQKSGALVSGTAVAAAALQREDLIPVVRVITPPKEITADTPVVWLTYPPHVSGLHFVSPFRPSDTPEKAAEEERAEEDLLSARTFSSGPRARTAANGARFISFAASDAAVQPEEAEGVLSKLSHSLDVAHRLEAKGLHGAAQGKKMRKKLWKAQAAVTDALRKAASQEDWKYIVDEADVEGGSKRKKHRSEGHTVLFDASSDATKSSKASDWKASLAAFLGDEAAVKELYAEPRAAKARVEPPPAVKAASKEKFVGPSRRPPHEGVRGGGSHKRDRETSEKSERRSLHGPHKKT